MKLLTDYLTSRILLLLGLISRMLSINSRYYFGVFIGNVLRILSKTRSDVTLENIQKAFPEFDFDDQIKIRNASYHNLGITLLELMSIPKLSKEELSRYIKFENLELIKEVYSRGNGLILLSGHFGNWEMGAYSIGLFSDISFMIVVKPQSNKISDKYLNNIRTMGGNKIVPMSKAARTLVQTITNKEAVALLADQSADWRKDIFVDFFGRPAATYEAPARLALKYRCPIVMGFTHRLPDHTYSVKFEELDFSDLDNSNASIEELTQRHVKNLEENIRRNPGLWSWQHKRWKHDPPVKQ